MVINYEGIANLLKKKHFYNVILTILKVSSDIIITPLAEISKGR